jgi:hypothetical protein
MEDNMKYFSIFLVVFSIMTTTCDSPTFADIKITNNSTYNLRLEMFLNTRGNEFAVTAAAAAIAGFAAAVAEFTDADVDVDADAGEGFDKIDATSILLNINETYIINSRTKRWSNIINKPHEVIEKIIVYNNDTGKEINIYSFIQINNIARKTKRRWQYAAYEIKITNELLFAWDDTIPLERTVHLFIDEYFDIISCNGLKANWKKVGLGWSSAKLLAGEIELTMNPRKKWVGWRDDFGEDLKIRYNFEGGKTYWLTHYNWSFLNLYIGENLKSESDGKIYFEK